VKAVATHATESVDDGVAMIIEAEVLAAR